MGGKRGRHIAERLSVYPFSYPLTAAGCLDRNALPHPRSFAEGVSLRSELVAAQEDSDALRGGA